jgi:N-acylmannosamine kinase
MPQMPLSTSNIDSDVTSIAVDFGGTKISAARLVGNRIVDRRQVATEQDGSPEHHLRTIVEMIESLSNRESTTLGVAVCGRIDAKGYWHALNHNTLMQLSSFPLREKLETHFNCPVNVMNDGTAAAWGEYVFLKEHEKVDSFLYMTVSTGVGGGIVLNGKPLMSADGLATHLGFMSSPFGTETCGSGRFGTIESVASGTAIGHATGMVCGKHLTGYEAFQAHLSRDAAATAIVDRSASAIAKVIADVRALVGVQLVTIGGGVGLAEGYVDLVQNHLQEEPELFRPRVLTAKLGADSALHGIIK